MAVESVVVTAGALPGTALDTSNDADAAVTADRVQDAITHGHALFLEGASAANA